VEGRSEDGGVLEFTAGAEAKVAQVGGRRIRRHATISFPFFFFVEQNHFFPLSILIKERK
jgi:hypothetical protein